MLKLKQTIFISIGQGKVMTKLFFLLLLFFPLTNSYAQLSFDEGTENIPQDLDLGDNRTDNLETINREKILRVSPYRKIFIISDETGYLSEGDYVSVYLGNVAVGRFLTIKKKSQYSGLKIINILSQESLMKLESGSIIGLHKGDGLINFSEAKTNQQLKKSEDNLDSEIVSIQNIIEEAGDISVDEDSKREIRTDNIVSYNYGQVSSFQKDGGKANYYHWNAQWQHQFLDNIWAELSYGQSAMKDFPGKGANSTLNQLLIRAKYTVEAPLNSYFQPYIGFRYIKISAPPPNDQMSSAEKETESTIARKAEKKDLIFGATLLKRLVPGWFARADIGIDIISIGISFEF